MSNTILKGFGSPAPLTVSSSSVALPSIPHEAHRATVRVTGADVHVENDATAATTNDFLVRAEEVIHLTDNRFQLTDYRFIRAASIDATLYISYTN